MRRTALTTAVLVAALAPTATAATARPALRVLTHSPLLVAGSHFRPAERVTVVAGGRRIVVRTTAAGLFRASFGQIAYDRCSMGIAAFGARGDRAVLPAKPECPPP